MSPKKNVSADGPDPVFEEIPGPLVSHVVVLDANGVITWVSRSWEQFASQNRGTVESVSVGVNYLDVCSRASGNDPIAKQALDGIRAVLARELPIFAIEYPCPSPVEKRWFLMNVHPMPIDHGGVTISHVEITANKSAPLSLRESEERYWLLVEHAPDPIAVHRNGLLLYVNRAAAELLGARQPSELIGSPLVRFAHPETLSSTKDPFHDVYMGSLPLAPEKLVRLDGRSIFAELTTIPITYQGEPAALSVARDVTERRRLQEELRRRDREIAALVENSPDVIFRIDPELRCTYVSSAITRRSGVPAEQIVGRSVEDVQFVGYDAKELAERCRAVLQTGEEVQKEISWNDRYYRTRIIPQFAPDGTIEWLLGITDDITERRRAEEAQHAIERQYESLINSIESIVWELDYPSYRFKFVSKQAERVLGYPVSQWLEDPDFFPSHIHPEDNWVPDFCRNATEKGKDHQFEYRMIAADGSVVWLRDMVTVESIDGRPIHVRGVMIDITESRLAKQESEALHKELELERARLELVLRQMPGGVIIIDAPSGNLVMVNKQMEEICRQTFENVKNISEFRDFSRTLHVDFLASETIDRLLGRSIREGEITESEEIGIVRADGTRGMLSVSSAPIRDHEGKIIAGVASFSDITERKEEEKLRTGQNTVLKMIAAGYPLPQILARLVHLIESQSHGMVGSVLMLDEDGRHLHHGAAPSLPQSFVRAIDGAAIGPRAGSCGTAMYTGRAVMVTDIFTDPLWEGYRELVIPLGLKACWSMPIRSTGDKILGSFAMYYRDNRGPTPKERRLISIAVHLAGIAIERQGSEQALRDSEERNRATLRAIPDLILLMSRDGTYLDCHAKNPEELLLPEHELIGKNRRDVLPPELAERFAEVDRKVLSGDEPQVLEYSLVVEGLVRDAEARVVRAGEDKILVLVRDITQRKRAEEELRRNSEQIRELAGKLITAQEEERSRVSRELHDDIIQKVAALAIGMSMLKRKIPERQRALSQELASLQRQVDMLADDIRALSHQLHPAVLDHSGVLQAVRSFTGEFTRLEGVDVKLSLPECDERISRDVGMCVYRIVQESLRNVAKHSGAKRAEVTLLIDHDEVHLLVKDYGKGFNVDHARGAGLGMVSIEERVRLCQGDIQITSQLNQGTTLSARIPLVSALTDPSVETLQ